MADRPTLSPHEATLAASKPIGWSAQSGNVCGAVIETVPASGGTAVETDSWFICTKPKPCPDHPVKDCYFGGTSPEPLDD